MANAVSTEITKIHAEIDAWFAKHFHNTKISQDDSAYAIAHAAKEDLKTIIAPTVDENASIFETAAARDNAAVKDADK